MIQDDDGEDEEKKIPGYPLTQKNIIECVHFIKDLFCGGKMYLAEVVLGRPLQYEPFCPNEQARIRTDMESLFVKWKGVGVYIDPELYSSSNTPISQDQHLE